MAEKMRAMVLTKLAPIETHPLKLMSIDKPTIKGRKGLIPEIEAAAYAGQTCILLKATGKNMAPLRACQ